jgi:hypothetical protein
MMALAERPTDDGQAIDDVRYYLRAWRRWVGGWRAPLGVPSAVPYVHEMLPSVSGGAFDEQENDVAPFILRAVDAEIERLPIDQRAAVRLVYLNEVTSSVFRSGRMTIEAARRLCAAAEADMVPKLRVRGIVLGGY